MADVANLNINGTSYTIKDTVARNAMSGPLVAATKSAMTNTSKVYVYTGSESGMTNGNWYYHNGSAWVSGGVYNSTAFETDKTLTVSDMAADAKVTGDEINVFNKFKVWGGKNLLDLSRVVTGYTIDGSGVLASSGNNAQSTKNFLPVSPSTSYVCSVYGRTAITISTLLVVAFYSAASESSFLSRVTNVSSFTTPANTHFIRVSSSARDSQNNIVGFYEGTQIEAGTIPTKYEPYYKLKDVSVGFEAFNGTTLKDFSNFYNGKLVKIDPIEIGIGYLKADGTINVATGFSYKTFSVKDPNQLFFYTGELLGSAGVPMFACYDDSDAMISHSCAVVSTSTSAYYKDYQVSVPSNTAKITFCARGDFFVKQLRMFEESPHSSSYSNFMGHLNSPTLTTDFCYIPFYGQSLSLGADAPYATDDLVNGVDILKMPSDVVVSPYILSSDLEQPAFSSLTTLRDLVYRHTTDRPTFIASSFGTGGASIAQLMSSARQSEIKTTYGYSYNIDSSPSYNSFYTSVANLKTMADRLEASINCPAIVFMQGERDYSSDAELIDAGASNPHAYACGNDKTRYKAMLTALKNDMQSRCMSTFGQTNKPLFLLYQVSGQFVGKHDLGITEAQREFAEENDDVILLPATYFVPNYNSGHLSTNGYRWYGEFVGKSLFNALVNNCDTKPILFSGAYLDGTKVHIKVANAELPLVIDDYTVEEAITKGFRVWDNGNLISISDISVCGDEIIITTHSTLTSGQTEISYAGSEVRGTGNIRDSSVYVSKYLYLDDSSDTGTSGSLTISHRAQDASGNYITGKHYPMYNWLSPFYATL